MPNPLTVRGVHLDLKGLPPTVPRLLRLLEIFAAAKFNCVLVEWEDAFPWELDARFRSETAYSRRDVDEFHRVARSLGLQIIPLVQSLGHMETPLRLEECRALREVPDRCDGLNPLAAGARDLVEQMVDEMLRVTGPITHFHLGGDEAFTFGTHPQTRAFIEKHGKAALYLQHIEPLLDMLLARGVRPILWHDMLHDWDEAALSRLKVKADLMVWSYQGHPDSSDAKKNTRVIERFHAAGVPMWGACAFKGADSSGDADLPNLDHRIVNTSGWMDVANRFDMFGVVATGWSRYTTHRVQCEPIDAALDALLEVGAVLHDGKPMGESARTEALKSLEEFERFNKCRASLSKLSQARRLCLKFVLLCRQQAAVERIDDRRRGSGMWSHLRDIAVDRLRDAMLAGDEVRAAFKGLIEDIWIERFIAERIEPLNEELAALCRI